ncbi:MAG: tRNA (guanosine(46)-N7)-methyltransferase TrmB, partial [Tepidisphaeraceae bacterium]
AGVTMHTKHELIPEPIGLDVDQLSRPLNFLELFGNDHPLELEIGMGKGTFLTEQAKARPDVNFFGVEWARWFWRYSSDRLRRGGCTNARTVRAEAGYFLTEFVPPQSLSVLHIYFPDPWPKARHHKRRLIQPKFMPLVARVVKPGGRIQVVTDHAGYWEENIEPTIRAAEGFQVVDYTRPGSASAGEFVGTNFERKYAREGRPFYAIAAVRG